MDRKIASVLLVCVIALSVVVLASTFNRVVLSRGIGDPINDPRPACMGDPIDDPKPNLMGDPINDPRPRCCMADPIDSPRPG